MCSLARMRSETILVLRGSSSDLGEFKFVELAAAAAKTAVDDVRVKDGRAAGVVTEVVGLDR